MTLLAKYVVASVVETIVPAGVTSCVIRYLVAIRIGVRE